MCAIACVKRDMMGGGSCVEKKWINQRYVCFLLCRNKSRFLTKNHQKINGFIAEDFSL